MSNLVDAFASSLFFRILLPGLVLAGGLHPFIATSDVAPLIGDLYGVDPTVLMLIEITVFGLLAYAATIPVYHIVHGVRLRWLTWPAARFTRFKLDRKIVALNALYGTTEYAALDQAHQDDVRKLHNYLHDFPLEQDESGAPRYSMPSTTRLGCIIDNYTSYSESRYGVDAHHFWNHILYVLPESMRKELDGNEAVAQGMVMSAASSWLTLALAVGGLAFTKIGQTYPAFAVFGPAPDARTLVTLACAAALAILLFNALAREAHRDFGRHLQAAIDVHAKDLSKFLLAAEAPFPEDVRLRASGLYTWTGYLLDPTEPRAADVAQPTEAPEPVGDHETGGPVVDPDAPGRQL